MKIGFPRQLLPTLVCQVDAEPLTVHAVVANDSHIIDGTLACSSCAATYPIIDGIAYLLGGQEQLSDVMKTEITSRDAQAHRYNEKLQTRYAKEVPSTLRALGDIVSKKIIEYGSGTGRFTKEIARKADFVLAIDFSLASLEWAQDNLQLDNVG